MAEKDYYAILGVSRSATPAEIKKAFRAKAVELHPDRNPDNSQAEEQFKELNAAYAVLSDAQKRANYDRFGNEKFHQQFTVDDIFSGTDFTSIFNDLGVVSFHDSHTRVGGSQIDSDDSE